MSFDWSFVLTTLPAFGKSVWVTLQLGALVILSSLAVALLNVTLQSLHRPWLNRVIRAYVELARNTPLLIQLFFLYFGLPALGLSLSGFAKSSAEKNQAGYIARNTSGVREVINNMVVRP